MEITCPLVYYTTFIFKKNNEKSLQEGLFDVRCIRWGCYGFVTARRSV